MNTAEFVLQDWRRGLFPLRHVEEFARLGSEKILKFISDEVLSRNEPSAFLACPVDFALKDSIHLRRTLVLDPIATCYLYEFVLKNHKRFTAGTNVSRQSVGYAFRKGIPVNSFEEYHKLRKRRQQLAGEYKFYAKLDITNCFNSFYHHDIVEAVQSGIGEIAASQFGKYLREINQGTSVHCFPQGLYPAKVVGSWLLSFVERSTQLKCPVILRFIDDIWLFSDSRDEVDHDILALQRLLARYSLSLNAEKTVRGSGSALLSDASVDDIKVGLLRKRASQSPYEDEFESEHSDTLDDEQLEYLRSRLTGRDVAEEDVELAIALVRKDDQIQEKLIKLVVERHPHLLKTLYLHVEKIGTAHADILFSAVTARLKRPVITSHELFWLARLVLDCHEECAALISLVERIYVHPSATSVVKAAILETACLDYGMDHMKLEAIREQPGTMLGAAAMVGIRRMGKGVRNHQYKYAAKANRYASVFVDILSSN